MNSNKKIQRKAYIVHNLDSLATLLLMKWAGIEFDSIECVSYKNVITKLEEKFLINGDNKKYDEFYFINFYNDVLDDFKSVLEGYTYKSLVSDRDDMLTYDLANRLLGDKLQLNNDQHLFLELISDIELNYFENNKSLLVCDMFNTLGFAYSKFLEFYDKGFKPHSFFKESINKFKINYNKNQLYKLKFKGYTLISVIGEYSDIYFYCYKMLTNDEYDGMVLIDTNSKKVYFKVKNISPLNGLLISEKMCNGCGTRLNSSGDLTNTFLQFIRKFESI